jgi:hypothetical protein
MSRMGEKNNWAPWRGEVGWLCIWTCCTHKLIIFTKKSKKTYICSLNPIPSVYKILWLKSL